MGQVEFVEARASKKVLEELLGTALAEVAPPGIGVGSCNCGLPQDTW